MDIQTAQVVGQTLQSIETLSAAVNEIQALIDSKGSLSLVQLSTGAPVNLAAINLTADQTNTILGDILTYLQGLLAEAAKTLAAIS